MKKIKKYIEKFEYWKAKELIDKAIKSGRKDPEYYFQLGHILRGAGELEKALSAYEKAKELGQEKAPGYKETVQLMLEGKD